MEIEGVRITNHDTETRVEMYEVKGVTLWPDLICHNLQGNHTTEVGIIESPYYQYKEFFIM